MLKKLYIDNYRSLVNFEVSFDRVALMMGPNGGGKTSIVDLLYGIRRMITDNARVGEVFPQNELTAWLDKNDQVFELTVSGTEGEYLYRLVINHNPDLNKQRIESEQLSIDGNPLFSSKQGEIQLFHDDHTKGTSYSFDWTISGLATITPRNDNKKLTWFKNWIENLYIIRLLPTEITSVSEEETAWLSKEGKNFASWYRYFSQEYQGKVMTLYQALRKAIPGFEEFKLETAGRYRILKVGFRNENSNHLKTLYYEFERLSDGQRALIVLYSLLIRLKDTEYTLIIDEPENYVALPEIQPWLLELNDLCSDGLISQVLLISHHPELIDYFGPECGRWIEREALNPSRVKPLPRLSEDDLRLSETIARGWLK